MLGAIADLVRVVLPGNVEGDPQPRGSDVPRFRLHQYGIDRLLRHLICDRVFAKKYVEHVQAAERKEEQVEGPQQKDQGQVAHVFSVWCAQKRRDVRRGP